MDLYYIDTMDIDEIINHCSRRSSDIRRLTFDQRILLNIPYIASNDDDNMCKDLETLYNTVYTKESSYGSSGRYAMTPNIENGSRKKREHYSNCNCNIFPRIFVVVMILVIIILLQRVN